MSISDDDVGTYIEHDLKKNNIPESLRKQFLSCFAAAERGVTNEFTYLLKMNPELLNARVCNDMTPLSYASSRGYLNVVKLLIQFYDPNPFYIGDGEQGKTARELAPTHNIKDAILSLEEHWLFEKNYTPNHYTQPGYIKISKNWLSDFLPHIDLKRFSVLAKKLARLVKGTPESLDVTKIILKYQPALIQQDCPVNNGKTTLLHYAVKKKDTELLQLALAHNPALGLEDNKGRTPLEFATERAKDTPNTSQEKLILMMCLEAELLTIRDYNLSKAKSIDPHLIRNYPDKLKQYLELAQGKSRENNVKNILQDLPETMKRIIDLSPEAAIEIVENFARLNSQLKVVSSEVIINLRLEQLQKLYRVKKTPENQLKIETLERTVLKEIIKSQISAKSTFISSFDRRVDTEALLLAIRGNCEVRALQALANCASSSAVTREVLQEAMSHLEKVKSKECYAVILTLLKTRFRYRTSDGWLHDMEDRNWVKKQLLREAIIYEDLATIESAYRPETLNESISSDGSDKTALFYAAASNNDDIFNFFFNKKPNCTASIRAEALRHLSTLPANSQFIKTQQRKIIALDQYMMHQEHGLNINTQKNLLSSLNWTLEQQDLTLFTDIITHFPMILTWHDGHLSPETILVNTLKSKQFEMTEQLLLATAKYEDTLVNVCYPLQVSCIDYPRGTTPLEMCERQLMTTRQEIHNNKIAQRGPSASDSTRETQIATLRILNNRYKCLKNIFNLLLVIERKIVAESYRAASNSNIIEAAAIQLKRFKLAIMAGDTAQVSELLNSSPSLMQQRLNASGDRAISFAVYYQQTDVIKTLLARVPRPDILQNNDREERAWTIANIESRILSIVAPHEKPLHDELIKLILSNENERLTEEAIIKGDIDALKEELRNSKKISDDATSQSCLLTKEIGLRCLWPLTLAKNMNSQNNTMKHKLVEDYLLSIGATEDPANSRTPISSEHQQSTSIVIFDKLKNPSTMTKIYEHYVDQLRLLSKDQKSKLNYLKSHILKTVADELEQLHQGFSQDYMEIELQFLLNSLFMIVKDAKDDTVLLSKVKELLKQREQVIIGTAMDYDHDTITNQICSRLVTYLFPQQPLLRSLLPSLPEKWCRLNGDDQLPELGEPFFRSSNGKIYLYSDVIDYAFTRIKENFSEQSEIWGDLSTTDLEALANRSTEFADLYAHTRLLSIKINPQNDEYRFKQLIDSLDAANYQTGGAIDRAKDSLKQAITDGIDLTQVKQRVQTFCSALTSARINIEPTQKAFQEYLTASSLTKNIKKEAFLKLLQDERNKAGSHEHTGIAAVEGLREFDAYWKALHPTRRAQISALSIPGEISIGQNIQLLIPQETYRIVHLSALPDTLSSYKYAYLYIQTLISPKLYYIQSHGHATSMTYSAEVVPINNFYTFEREYNRLKAKSSIHSYTDPTSSIHYFYISIDKNDATNLIVDNTPREKNYQLRGGFNIDVQNVSSDTTTCAAIRGDALARILRDSNIKAALSKKPIQQRLYTRYTPEQIKLSLSTSTKETVRIITNFSVFSMYSVLDTLNYQTLFAENEFLKSLEHNTVQKELLKSLETALTSVGKSKADYAKAITEYIEKQTDNTILMKVMEILQHQFFDDKLRPWKIFTRHTTTLRGMNNVATSKTWKNIEICYDSQFSKNLQSATQLSTAAGTTAPRVIVVDPQKATKIGLAQKAPEMKASFFSSFFSSLPTPSIQTTQARTQPSPPVANTGDSTMSQSSSHTIHL